ncbi:hypothetical protein Tco_1203797 [Tanacetum coccineum]
MVVVVKDLERERQSKESKKQTILEEIKRKAPGKGLGAAPESPDHSNSSDDSSEYTNDDKTESESDSKHGDENDKSVNEDESADSENDDSNKDSCNDKDQTANFKVVKQRLDNHEQRMNSLSQVNNVEAIEESIKANLVNEVKNQLPKFVPKVVSDYVKPRLERTILDVMKKNLINLFKSSYKPVDTLTKYKLKHKLYEMM